MECTEIIEKAINTIKLGFKCIPYEKRMCIVTPYLYPDNDLIEIFVEEIGNTLIRVTDLGETLRHLESIGLDLLGSRKRKFLLEQIINRLHVNIVNGKLEKDGLAEDVGSMLLDVAATAHAVADLIYTSKAYEPTTFNEEVGLFLTEHKINHNKNYKVIGDSGKAYRVGFRINGDRSSEMLIETLSPPQETAMTSSINRALRKWFDIDGGRHKVSLFNDLDYSWKEEDKTLLRRVSKISNWSDKDGFLQYIKTN